MTMFAFDWPANFGDWAIIVVGALGPIGLFYQWWTDRRDRLVSEAEQDEFKYRQSEGKAQREAFTQITESSVRFTQIAEALVEPMSDQIKTLIANQKDLQAQVSDERSLRQSLERRFDTIVNYVADLRQQARDEKRVPLPIPPELTEHFSEDPD